VTLPRILITGATGTFCGEIARQLQALGEPIRILIRDAAKVSRHCPSVQAVVGDFAAPDSLDTALAGIERVFLASTDKPDQAEMQRNVLTAAKRHGVRHIVRISTMGVHEKQNIPIFDQHKECEQQLEQSGLDFTHLRPSWVMQNFLPSSSSAPVTGDMIRLSAGDGRVGFVDARDVAAVAVQALATSGHTGKAYELTGPEALSHSEFATRLAAASGRRIVYEDISPDVYEREKVSQGWPRASIDSMLELFADVRAGVDCIVTDTVERVTGRAALNARDFARDHASRFRAGA
jgi:uncharacterized protein YbjT (DUF2867 family)